MIGADAIDPSRHFRRIDNPASRDRSAGLCDHLGLAGKTLRLRRRSFFAGSGKIGHRSTNASKEVVMLKRELAQQG
jgi:hypothetical protein